MVNKLRPSVAPYSAPALKEVCASIEYGFAASGAFGSDDYEKGNEDWLN